MEEAPGTPQGPQSPQWGLVNHPCSERFRELTVTFAQRAAMSPTLGSALPPPHPPAVDSTLWPRRGRAL